MKKALFQIESSPMYIGYTDGTRWNGWATPFFTFEEAQKIQSDWNAEGESQMLYDIDKDAFCVQYDDDDPYIWKGEDVQTEDGIKHLYGIGAYSHIWDKVGQEEKRYLAYQVNDFIMDYDPYEYRDAFDDEDEAFEAIISNFDDLEIFAETQRIINNITLSSDQIFSGLSKILDI